jgi:hypothetical protein
MNRHIVQPKQHDFNRLKPHFGFVPVGRIQHTIANTSQFARMDTRLPLRKHFKSRFPAANISRLNDTVATDTFFSDVPAHDDGIMGSRWYNHVAALLWVQKLTHCWVLYENWR